jgi:hypothetical protein
LPAFVDALLLWAARRFLNAVRLTSIAANDDVFETVDREASSPQLVDRQRRDERVVAALRVEVLARRGFTFGIEHERVIGVAARDGICAAPRSDKDGTGSCCDGVVAGTAENLRSVEPAMDGVIAWSPIDSDRRCPRARRRELSRSDHVIAIPSNDRDRWRGGR